MEYCPVIIQIVDAQLQEHYKGNFLLQVYDKLGVKKFEKVLMYDVSCWNICYNYLCFKLDEKEADSQYIHIVHFQKNFALLKVKDFLNDISYVNMVVNQDCLFYTNSKTFQIMDISVDLKDGETKEVEIDPSKRTEYSINSPNRIHTVFENGYSVNDKYIMCAIEMEDNIFDFTRLYFWNRDFQNPQLEFFQYREIVHRDILADPIVSFKQFIKKNEFQFGVALRSSGFIDLYWNFTLVNTPVEKFVNIDINCHAFYLTQDKRDPVTGFPIKNKIQLKWDTRIGMEVSETISIPENQQYTIQFSTLKKYIRPFKRFTLFTTYLFIAHGHIVSCYDLMINQFIKHFYFSDEIFNICRHEYSYENYNLGVFLKNGGIKVIIQKDDVWEISDTQEYKIQGSIEQIVFDWRKVNTNYLLIQNNNKYEMQGFSSAGNTNLLRLYSKQESAELVIYDPDTKSLNTYTNYSYEGSFSLSLEKQITLNYPPDFNQLHSAVKLDDKTMLLYDRKHMYKVDLSSGNVETNSKYKVRNLIVIDNKHLYQMRDHSIQNNQKPGFYYQDIGLYIKQNIENLFDIDQGIGGVNGLIDYNEDQQRMAYLKNYEELLIVPSLHRNVINFFGMKTKEYYMSTKKIFDKFYALDQSNVITTWNVCTGKVISKYKISNQIDFGKFELFQKTSDDDTYLREWYPFILLKSKESIADYDEKNFYAQDQLTSKLDSETAYLNLLEKHFHTFKIVEIINEREIKEQLSFIHPIIVTETYQRIYFSEKFDYMLERLLNQRVFLYKKEKTQSTNGDENTLVKWVLVKRLAQFPMDISEVCYNNYLFSPDLMYYLDFDKSQKQFLIKETLTQNIFKRMPKGLMDPETPEKVLHLVQKFKWVDNRRFQVINENGLDKMVDIYEDFKEIAYSSVPFATKLDDYCKDKSYHYYFNQPEIAFDKLQKRLIRKVQAYKDAVYMKQLTSVDDLYDQLFVVDYRISSTWDGNINQQISKFAAETSFTFVHWRIIETLNKDKNFNIDNISYKELKKLCLNILPNGDTILHKIFKKYKVIEKLYDVALNTENKIMYIPFIKNFQNRSPLNLCFEKRNLRVADLMIKNLMKEPLDYHGRAVADALINGIENGLISVSNYIDARLIEIEDLKNFKKGSLNLYQGSDYAITYAEIWYNTSELNKNLFTQNPLETDINIKILDIPYLNCYEEETSTKFFGALSDCKKIEIFGSEGIQTLIDFKWPLAKEYTIKYLFIPYCIFMGLFLAEGNGLFNNEYSDSRVDVILCSLLLACCFYFFLNECRQLFYSGLDYFKSFWNYSDLLPPILIVIIIIIHFKQDDSSISFQATMRAFASLLMWSKFFYFMRLFEATGYLVRTLSTQVYEMRYFVLCLLFAYFAFGEAFLRLSQMSDPSAQFIDNNNYALSIVYTLRLSLGDFNTDSFDATTQPVTCWILFFLCALITNILMMNILIAIISESYDDIKTVRELNAYKEKASIIYENSYLIPKSRMKSHCPKGKYLIVAKELSIEEKDQENDMKDKIGELAINLSEMVNFFCLFLQRKSHLDTLNSIKDSVEQLLNKK